MAISTSLPGMARNFIPVGYLLLTLFIAGNMARNCNSDLRGSMEDSGGSQTLRSLLSVSEFNQLNRLGLIEKSFVVRFSELSQLKSVALWTERQSNAFIIWSRRTGGEWMPVKNLKGDRKVFRLRRSKSKQSILDQSPALLANELLFLPLRQMRLTKEKYSTSTDLQWLISGCSHGQVRCGCFDGTGTDQLVHDLKRSGALTESEGGFSFYLKTRSYSGLIVSSYGTQGDFVLVQVKRGRLMVVIDFGGNQPRSLSTSVIVNDGVWHGLSVQYVHDDFKIYVDGILAASSSNSLSGYRLDLDRNIIIGGAPYTHPFVKFMVAENITGCVDDLVWNNRSIDSYSGKAGSCKQDSVILSGSIVAFMDGNAWIEKRGRQIRSSASPASIRLSVQFRTVSERGHIWRAIDNDRTPWSDSISNLSLSLIDGFLACQLILDGDVFTLKSHERIDDGLWHRTDLNIRNHLIELAIDHQPTVRLEAKFKILAPPDQLYQLGGDGFIGCVQQLAIDGHEKNLRNYEKRWKPTSGGDDGLIWDRCSLWDRCQPNPCENGGKCQRSTIWNEFICVCPDGYSGHLCTNVELAHSCQEHHEFPSSQRHQNQRTAKIDLDDIGPMNALEVECRADGSTVLRHDQTEPVEIYGFPDRGSAQIDFNYSGIDPNSRTDSMPVATLTMRSKQCRQEMSYKCLGGSTLMEMAGRRTIGQNQDRGPSSWWLSWMATHVYAWGDGEPDSMMCSCGISGACENGRYCNCNGDRGMANSEDIGNATIKELLPIRRILVGDTDFNHKRAIISIGPLVCSGDDSLDPLTFLDRTAFVDVPFKPRHPHSNVHAMAGYLQFRTRECIFSLVSTIRNINAEEDDGCEYLRLHVENCKTAVLVICGGGGVMKLTANFTEAVNDDRWHSIRFTVTSTTLAMVLDNAETSRTNSHHLYMAPDPEIISSWRLGSTGEYGSGFTGVIRSVFLNGHLIPISHLDKLGHVRGSLLPGHANRCISIDENGVEDNDGWCFNDGKCEEYYHKLVCDCSATPFTGSRCQQDVSYELIGALSFAGDTHNITKANVDCLRIGFQTKSGSSNLLRGIDKRTKTEVIALLLTDTGSLSLVYTESYPSYKVVEDGRNFADGYFHDVVIRVNPENRSISMEVDQSRLRMLEWRYPSTIRPALNRLDWIIGDDGLTSLFSGCISRLQIGQSFFPLKNFGSMLRSVGDGSGTRYRRSVCPAIEENMPEMDIDVPALDPTPVGKTPIAPMDTVSRWSDAPRVKVRPLKASSDRSIIVGVIGAVALCVFLLVLCCLVRFCRNRPAGEYKTHEETLYLSGPMTGHDSSQQALVTATGDPSPSPVERREWFI